MTSFLLKRPLNAPSILTYPGVHSAVFKTKHFTPFWKALYFTSELIQFTIIPIPVLFFGRSPSTISWFVVPFSIWKTIKRMICRWCRTHIAQECREIIPLLTKPDPGPTIPIIPNGFRIEASLLHHLPDGIFPYGFITGAATMLCLVGGIAFTYQTATTLSLAGPDSVSSYVCMFPAITKAFPENKMTTLYSSTDNGKSVMLLACHRNEVVSSEFHTSIINQ